MQLLGSRIGVKALRDGRARPAAETRAAVGPETKDIQARKDIGGVDGRHVSLAIKVFDFPHGPSHLSKM